MNEERYWKLLAKKLSGELTRQEAAEWAQLRCLFPQLHFRVDSLEQLWVQHPAPPSPEAEAALERHLRRMIAAGIVLP